ncbi:hypothetical protein ACOSQ3_006710 [Xanthoceras sorbifolium]
MMDGGDPIWISTINFLQNLSKFKPVTISKEEEVFVDSCVSLRISAKFFGTEVEFDVDNPFTYTLATLCVDVYMYGCSTLPEPIESFKVEALIPWRGIFKVIADDDYVFAQYKSKHIRTIRLDVELLPLAWSPFDEFHGQVSPLADLDNEGGTNNVSTSFDEDSDFLLQSSYEDAETECDIGRHSFEFVHEDMFGEGFLYSEENGVEEGSINEEEQQLDAGDYEQQQTERNAVGVDDDQQQTEGNAADGDYDQQQTDSGNESDEDALSDAASFHFDQDFAVLTSSNDEVGSVKSSGTRTSKKRLNFKVSSSSKVPTKKTAVQTVVDVGSSQPVTQTAPLHSSQVSTQQAQSKSNLGTVAALDIDWSGIVLVLFYGCFCVLISLMKSTSGYLSAIHPKIKLYIKKIKRNPYFFFPNYKPKSSSLSSSKFFFNQTNPKK